jgi:hypothetical protein
VIANINVPPPKFNNFNSALDQAVSDTKRAVRDINNALKIKVITIIMYLSNIEEKQAIPEKQNLKNMD